MKRIGMLLAIAVLAGSLPSSCLIRPPDGHYGDRGYSGHQGYSGDRGYSGHQGYNPGHPGSEYHRDR